MANGGFTGQQVGRIGSGFFAGILQGKKDALQRLKRRRFEEDVAEIGKLSPGVFGPITPEQSGAVRRITADPEVSGEYAKRVRLMAGILTPEEQAEATKGFEAKQDKQLAEQIKASATANLVENFLPPNIHQEAVARAGKIVNPSERENLIQYLDKLLAKPPEKTLLEKEEEKRKLPLLESDILEAAKEMAAEETRILPPALRDVSPVKADDIFKNRYSEAYERALSKRRIATPPKKEVAAVPRRGGLPEADISALGGATADEGEIKQRMEEVKLGDLSGFGGDFERARLYFKANLPQQLYDPFYNKWLKRLPRKR